MSALRNFTQRLSALRRFDTPCVSRSYLLVLVMVVAFTVPLLQLADSTAQCGAEKVAEELVERVQPGHYQARKCSPWRFTGGSEQLLSSLTSGLLREADKELLTSNHVKIPVCLLAWKGKVLINPVVRRHSEPTRKRTRVPELCGDTAPEIEMLFEREIELEWQTASNETQQLAVASTDALRIQKALSIMNGTEVCRSEAAQ